MKDRLLNLKIEMLRHSLNYSDLAAILELSTVSVSKKMNGRVPFTLAEAKTIVDFFNSKGGNHTVESLFFVGTSEISETQKARG